MACGCVTVNLSVEVAVFPPTVTLTLAVMAPWGTLVVILVVVAADTVAMTAPIFTVFLESVGLKFVPLISKTVPTGPEDFDKLVIVGAFVSGVDGPSS